MSRNPSKILSVKEAKLSDLGRKIEVQRKIVVKAEKVFSRETAVLDKLLAREAKATPKAEAEVQIEL